MSPQFAQMLSVMLQMRQMRQQGEQFEQTHQLQAAEGQRAERETALKEHDTQLRQAQSFIKFLQTLPDAESRDAFINAAGKVAGVGQQDATTLSSHLPVDPQTLAAKLTQQAVLAGQVNPAQVANVALTGRGTGENAASGHAAEFFGSGGFGNPALMQAYDAQTFGHMTPGGMAVDAQIPTMQPNTLRQAAEIALGTGMSAPQAAQHVIALGNLGISQGQLGVAQEQNKIQGFGANTQRIGVNNQADQFNAEARLRALGLYAGGGQNAGMQNMLEAGRIMQQLTAELNKPGTPAGVQEVIRNLMKQYAPYAGFDANSPFMNYLNPQLTSPGAGTGLLRR